MTEIVAMATGLLMAEVPAGIVTAAYITPVNEEKWTHVRFQCVINKRVTKTVELGRDRLRSSTRDVAMDIVRGLT